MAAKLDRIRNFTPHPITVFLDDNKKNEYPVDPSKYEARAATQTQKLCSKLHDESPVYEAPVYTGLAKPLPDDVNPKRDVLLMSAISAEAARAGGYEGLIVIPDSGPDSSVRGDKGQIIGVKRLYVA